MFVFLIVILQKTLISWLERLFESLSVLTLSEDKQFSSGCGKAMSTLSLTKTCSTNSQFVALSLAALLC